MEKRLTELETRVAFQDDMLQKLNDVVIKQQDQIDRLIAGIQSLQEQLNAALPDLLADQSQEQPPPHY